MKKEAIAVFISLYKGLVDEVYVFKDQRKGENYYKGRVIEEYGSEEEYEKALEYGVNTEYRLHYGDLK